MKKKYDVQCISLNAEDKAKVEELKKHLGINRTTALIRYLIAEKYNVCMCSGANNSANQKKG